MHTEGFDLILVCAKKGFAALVLPTGRREAGGGGGGDDTGPVDLGESLSGVTWGTSGEFIQLKSEQKQEYKELKHMQVKQQNISFTETCMIGLNNKDLF